MTENCLQKMALFVLLLSISMTSFALALTVCPVTYDDSVTTDEYNSVTIDVLANDVYPDNLPLPPTVASYTQPGSGTVTLNTDSSFTYTPNEDFCGTDSFTYTITDGVCESNPATVTIEVLCINNPPVAVDDSATTDEDTPVTIDVASNDYDDDGNLDPTTATAISGPGNGDLINNGDGTFTYTPDEGFCGYDSFDYEICDTDGLCDIATVDIEVLCVNHPPVAEDDSATTDEDTPVTIDVASNDYDDDGNLDPTTATAISSPGNGDLINNGDGSFTYTPDEGFCGYDSFDYKICDTDGLCDIATVDIEVLCINHPPVAVDDSATTDEDTPVTIDVASNDYDDDGNLDPTTAAAISVPINGDLINNGDGTFTYTPDEGFCGYDSFDYEICDTGGLCDIATVDIEVLCVNHPPVAVDDSATTDEDTPVTIDVASNDYDIDGNLDPTSTTATSNPTSGSLTNHGDGTFTYTPDEGFCGYDSFDYEICDTDGLCDSATVTIEVLCANDCPVAMDDSYDAAEDTPLTEPAPGVLGNDYDPDGDEIAVASYTQPSSGTVEMNPDGSFTYTPDENFCGTDHFTYKVTDGECDPMYQDEATVSIDVACANDCPVAMDDAYDATEDTPLTEPAPGVLGNDYDPDGDEITVASYTQPSSGTVEMNPDGSFTYTPDENFCGTDSFTYKVTDGECDPMYQDEATVTIDVACANDCPVAMDDAYDATEDTPLTEPAPGVLGNDNDPDGDEITVASYTQPSSGTVEMNPDGSFTYTPSENFCGTDSFTYKVTDGECDPIYQDEATVTIDVACANDCPVAMDDAYDATEDTPLTEPAPGVLGNDNDPDGDEITVASYTQPSSGTVEMNPDGSFYLHSQRELLWN